MNQSGPKTWQSQRYDVSRLDKSSQNKHGLKWKLESSSQGLSVITNTQEALIK